MSNKLKELEHHEAYSNGTDNAQSTIHVGCRHFLSKLQPFFNNVDPLSEVGRPDLSYDQGRHQRITQHLGPYASIE